MVKKRRANGEGEQVDHDTGAASRQPLPVVSQCGNQMKRKHYRVCDESGGRRIRSGREVKSSVGN